MPSYEEKQPLVSGFSGVPQDKYHVAYCIFALQGLGVLLPWNAFISAGDYFSALYGSSFVFFISLAFNWSGVFVFALLMKLLPRFSFLSRVLTSLALFFVVLIIIPFLDNFSTTVSMPITLVGVFITGFASSVLQSTVAGLAALFPPEYIGGMMSGSGFAGVIAILLRVITKVALPQTPEGLRTSGMLFFILSAAIMIVCAISFYALLRLPVTQHNLSNYFRIKNTDNARLVGSNSEATISQIVPKIWKDGLAVILTFFISLSLFPGITSLVKSNSDVWGADSSGWFSVFLTGLFMIGDVVGRSLPRWYMLISPKFLLFPTVLRFIFFPLFVFCIRPLIFPSDIITCCIVMVFAFSNGYLSTLGMIYGPQKVSAHEKELTGIIMSGCILAGIITGAHFGLLMLYLITGSVGISL